MVLIYTDIKFIGKRPSILKVLEEKKKMIEIYVPQKGMTLVEEPTTEEVSLNIVFSKKEEAELKGMFDSK